MDLIWEQSIAAVVWARRLLLTVWRCMNSPVRSFGKPRQVARLDSQMQSDHLRLCIAAVGTMPQLLLSCRTESKPSEAQQHEAAVRKHTAIAI